LGAISEHLVDLLDDSSHFVATVFFLHFVVQLLLGDVVFELVDTLFKERRRIELMRPRVFDNSLLIILHHHQLPKVEST